MNVSLNIDDEAIVERLVASGRFASKDDVLKAALRLLEEDMAQEETLSERIEQGLQALAHGDYKEYDADGLKTLAEEVKARGRKSLERTGATQR